MPDSAAIIPVSIDTSRIPAEFAAAINRAQATTKPIRLNIDAQPLGRITGDLKEFEKSLAASNARVIAFSSSTAVLYGMIGGFAALVKTTVDVEKKLKDINVILNASASNFAQLRSGLFNIAGSTGKAFDEVATAAAEFARQGLGVQETLKRTNDSMILSRIAMMNSKDAVQDLTTAVNTYKNEALDTTTILQKMVNVDAGFAVSSKDLADAISRTGAVARDAKVSFDQLLGAVTAVKQVTGREGSVIGNAFKTIFTRMEKPQTLDALEKIIGTTKTAEGAVRPLMDVLTELAKKYGSLDSAAKVNISTMVGGLHHMNILKALLGDLARENSVYKDAQMTAAAATNEATKRNEELNTSLSALAHRAAETGKQIASAMGDRTIAPGLRNALNGANRIFDSLKDFDSGSSMSMGANIGRGILDGIGSAIKGPGFILVSGLILSLFKKVGMDAARSIGEMAGLNDGIRKQEALQANINTLLNTGNQYYKARIDAAQGAKAKEAEIVKIIQEENALLQVRNSLSASIATSFTNRGISVPQAPGGAWRGRGLAEGYIPNLVNKESNDVRNGVGGASPSAKPVVIKDFNYGGGKRGAAVVNSDEWIVNNYGGNGSAVFNKHMVESMGLPSGAQRVSAASGYIPNFAAIKKHLGGFRLNKGNNPDSGISFSVDHKAKLFDIGMTTSAEKGDGFKNFRGVGELAKKRGYGLYSDLLVAQNDKLEDLKSRNQNPSSTDVLYSLFPQLRHRKGYTKSTTGFISQRNSRGGFLPQKFQSLDHLEQITSEMSEKEIRALNVDAVRDSFASGYIPNFVPNKELQRAFVQKFQKVKRTPLPWEGQKYSAVEGKKFFLGARVDSISPTPTTSVGSLSSVSANTTRGTTNDRQLARLIEGFDYGVFPNIINRSTVGFRPEAGGNPNATFAQAARNLKNTYWESLDKGVRTEKIRKGSVEDVKGRISRFRKNNIQDYLAFRQERQKYKHSDFLFRGVSEKEIAGLRRLGQGTSLGNSNADGLLGTFLTSSFGKAAGFGFSSSNSGSSYSLVLDKKRIMSRAHTLNDGNNAQLLREGGREERLDNRAFPSERLNTIKSGRIQKDDILHIIDLHSGTLMNLEDFKMANPRRPKIQFSEIKKHIGKWNRDYFNPDLFRLERVANRIKYQRLNDLDYAASGGGGHYSKEQMGKIVAQLKNRLSPDILNKDAAEEIKESKRARRQVLNRALDEITSGDPYRRELFNGYGTTRRMKSILSMPDAEILKTPTGSFAKGYIPNFVKYPEPSSDQLKNYFNNLKKDGVDTRKLNQFNKLGVGYSDRVKSWSPVGAIDAAIKREKKSASNVYVDSDSRLISSNNPNGLLVANRRDEPLGGFQGVSRAIAEGRDPKTYNVPNFAEPPRELSGDRISSQLARSNFENLSKKVQNDIDIALQGIDLSRIDFTKSAKEVELQFNKAIKKAFGTGHLTDLVLQESRAGLKYSSNVKKMSSRAQDLLSGDISTVAEEQFVSSTVKKSKVDARRRVQDSKDSKAIEEYMAQAEMGKEIKGRDISIFENAMKRQTRRNFISENGLDAFKSLKNTSVMSDVFGNSSKIVQDKIRQSVSKSIEREMGTFFEKEGSRGLFGGFGYGYSGRFNKQFGSKIAGNEELEGVANNLKAHHAQTRASKLQSAGIGLSFAAPIITGEILSMIESRDKKKPESRETNKKISKSVESSMSGLMLASLVPNAWGVGLGATMAGLGVGNAWSSNISRSGDEIERTGTERKAKRGELSDSLSAASGSYETLINANAGGDVLAKIRAKNQFREVMSRIPNEEETGNARGEFAKLINSGGDILSKIASFQSEQALKTSGINKVENAKISITKSIDEMSSSDGSDSTYGGTTRDAFKAFQKTNGKYSGGFGSSLARARWRAVNGYSLSGSEDPSDITEKFAGAGDKQFTDILSSLSSLVTGKDIDSKKLNSIDAKKLKGPELIKEVLRARGQGEGEINKIMGDEGIYSMRRGIDSKGNKGSDLLSLKFLEKTKELAQDTKLINRAAESEESIGRFYKISSDILAKVGHTFSMSAMKASAIRNSSFAKSEAMLSIESPSLTGFGINNLKTGVDSQKVEGKRIDSINNIVLEALDKAKIPEEIRRNPALTKQVSKATEEISKNPSSIFSQFEEISKAIGLSGGANASKHQEDFSRQGREASRKIDSTNLSSQLEQDALRKASESERIRIKREQDLKFLGGDFTQISGDYSKASNGFNAIRGAYGRQNPLENPLRKRDRIIGQSNSIVGLGDELMGSGMLENAPDHIKDIFGNAAKNGGIASMSKRIDGLISKAHSSGNFDIEEYLKQQKLGISEKAGLQEEARFKTGAAPMTNASLREGSSLLSEGARGVLATENLAKEEVSNTNALKELTKAMDRTVKYLTNTDSEPDADSNKARGFIPNFNAFDRERKDILRGVGGARAGDIPRMENIRGLGNTVVNSGESVVRNWMGTGKDAVLNRNMMKSFNAANGFVPNFANIEPVFGEAIKRMLERDTAKYIPVDNHADSKKEYLKRGKEYTARYEREAGRIEKMLLEKRGYTPLIMDSKLKSQLAKTATKKGMNSGVFFSPAGDGSPMWAEQKFGKGNSFVPESNLTKLTEAVNNRYMPTTMSLSDHVKASGKSFRKGYVGKALENTILKPINGLQSQGIIRPNQTIPNINPAEYMVQEAYPLAQRASFSKNYFLDKGGGIADINKNTFHDYTNAFYADEYRTHIATNESGKVSIIRGTTANKNSPFRSGFANIFQTRKVKAIQRAGANAVGGLPEEFRKGGNLFGVDVAEIQPEFAAKQNRDLGFEKFVKYKRSLFDRIVRGDSWRHDKGILSRILDGEIGHKYGYIGAIELNPTTITGGSGNAMHFMEQQAILSAAKGKTPLHGIVSDILKNSNLPKMPKFSMPDFGRSSAPKQTISLAEKLAKAKASPGGVSAFSPGYSTDIIKDNMDVLSTREQYPLSQSSRSAIEDARAAVENSKKTNSLKKSRFSLFRKKDLSELSEIGASANPSKIKEFMKGGVLSLGLEFATDGGKAILDASGHGDEKMLKSNLSNKAGIDLTKAAIMMGTKTFGGVAAYGIDAAIRTGVGEMQLRKASSLGIGDMAMAHFANAANSLSLGAVDSSLGKGNGTVTDVYQNLSNEKSRTEDIKQSSFEMKMRNRRLKAANTMEEKLQIAKDFEARGIGSSAAYQRALDKIEASKPVPKIQTGGYRLPNAPSALPDSIQAQINAAVAVDSTLKRSYKNNKFTSLNGEEDEFNPNIYDKKPVAQKSDFFSGRILDEINGKTVDRTAEFAELPEFTRDNTTRALPGMTSNRSAAQIWEDMRKGKGPRSEAEQNTMRANWSQRVNATYARGKAKEIADYKAGLEKEKQDYWRNQYNIPNMAGGYIPNFAAMTDSINREIDGLRKARGISSSEAKKNIFVGHNPEIGFGVGNYLDEPAGRFNPSLGLKQGIDRVRMEGGNPRLAGGYIPNYANNPSQANGFSELLETIKALISAIQSKESGGKSQATGSGVDVNHEINANVNISVSGNVQGANSDFQNTLNEELEKLKANIEKKLRELQDGGKYTPTPNQVMPKMSNGVTV
jgi:TP901 family phage tail tape measure protein